MAPDLDLIVDAAVEPKPAFVILSDEVAGAVIDRTVSVLSGILAEPGGSFFGVAIVAEPDTGAADPQFTDAVANNWPLFLVEDGVRKTIMYPAKRRKLAVGSLQ